MFISGGNGAATQATTMEAFAEEGSFSIFNWTGYPAEGVRPTGPFGVLIGEEYESARNSANLANNALHRTNQSLRGLQIHEIQPVKFNGSPTELTN